MRSIAPLFLVSALLCACAAADEKPPVKDTDQKPAAENPAKIEFKTLEEKVSYGFGRNLAAQVIFNRQFDFVDRDLLLRGFEDALRERKSPISEEDLNEAMIELSEKLQREDAARNAKLNPEEAKMAAENLKAGEEFLAKNKEREGIVTLESGLQYEVIAAGKGKRKPGLNDVITAHYHGTLIDGTVFDSSVDREEPAQFPVKDVIKGWIEALQLMQVGDKWKLYVPAKLAYGERGAGRRIGPNATLIFEVELLSIDTPE